MACKDLINLKTMQQDSSIYRFLMAIITRQIHTRIKYICTSAPLKPWQNIHFFLINCHVCFINRELSECGYRISKKWLESQTTLIPYTIQRWGHIELNQVWCIQNISVTALHECDREHSHITITAQKVTPFFYIGDNGTAHCVILYSDITRCAISFISSEYPYFSSILAGAECILMSVVPCPFGDMYIQ